eukprot:7369931-Pyramimonas_sp.AAC.1
MRIVRVILRGAVGFLYLTRAVGGYSAGSHRYRFGDIRRARLSNPELGTRTAARTRSAKLFVLFESS